MIDDSAAHAARAGSDATHESKLHLKHHDRNAGGGPTERIKDV